MRIEIQNRNELGFIDKGFIRAVTHNGKPLTDDTLINEVSTGKILMVNTGMKLPFLQEVAPWV